MPTPQQEVEIWTRLMAERSRDLMKNDSSLSKEEADEMAERQILQEIRRS